MQGFDRLFLILATFSVSLPGTTGKSMAEINGKQERMVVHLEIDDRHYYYGNLKALCDHWDKDAIGVGYAYLRNYGISEEKPFRNAKCIIRKGVLISSPRLFKDMT